MFDASTIDVSEIEVNVVAIDFGASNTDAAAVIGGKLRVWDQRSQGKPTAEAVRSIMAAGGVDLSEVALIAVTGGHHQDLPHEIDGIAVAKVGEVLAIGRGGQALASGGSWLPDGRMLVVSAGSGTAMVAADGHELRHITGTGVGGGTMLGLGRLILGTMDPEEIDRMALAGDTNGADLALRDLVSGPIGALPADATAVNFGRITRMEELPAPVDLAAALVTMMGQVIATLSINTARAAQVDRVLITGHMTDMQSMRTTMARVGTFFGMRLELCTEAGSATVLGALLYAVQK